MYNLSDTKKKLRFDIHYLSVFQKIAAKPRMETRKIKFQHRRLLLADITTATIDVKCNKIVVSFEKVS